MLVCSAPFDIPTCNTPACRLQLNNCLDAFSILPESLYVEISLHATSSCSCMKMMMMMIHLTCPAICTWCCTKCRDFNLLSYVCPFRYLANSHLTTVILHAIDYDAQHKSIIFLNLHLPTNSPCNDATRIAAAWRRSAKPTRFPQRFLSCRVEQPSRQ